MNGPHLFRPGHLVRDRSGSHALVVDAGNLAAVLQRPISFAPDERLEVDQGDPQWTVVQTAPGYCECCRTYVGEANLVDGDCEACWGAVWDDVLRAEREAQKRAVAVVKYFQSPFHETARWFRERGRTEEWLDMLEAGALSVPRVMHYTYPEGTER